MGHRLGEKNDLLLQRELRVETQIYDLSNKMNSILNAIDVLRREQAVPKPSEEGVRLGNPANASVKPVEKPLINTATKPLKVKCDSAEIPKPITSKPTESVPEVRVERSILTIPDSEREPAQVQIRGPRDSSSAMPSAMTLTNTQDQGVDPITIYLDSPTEVDLSHTKATMESQTDETVYLSAQTMLSGPNSLYLTVDNGMPSDNPCACSTRKKDQQTMDETDLSIQATRGSDEATRELEATEDELISPEQLKFTAAISKAMSSELAPLLAGRDLAQARPNVYRGSKYGSIDGWILVMRRCLKRTQSKVTLDDQARSIIGHLEGEARNQIINKAESERDSPEKVFELLSCLFGAGRNRMQLRQTFLSRVQQEKEDWMQLLDALEDLRSQGFPQEPNTTKRYEILQRFMEGVHDPVLRREVAIVYASEAFLADPPTVESLHFTTRQLQRSRPKTNQQPYDPRLTLRS